MVRCVEPYMMEPAPMFPHCPTLSRRLHFVEALALALFAVAGPAWAETADDEDSPARRRIVIEEDQVVDGSPPAPGVMFINPEQEAARRAMSYMLSEGRAGSLGMAEVSRAQPPVDETPVWKLVALSANAKPRAVGVALIGFEKRARRCRALVKTLKASRALVVKVDARGEITFAPDAAGQNDAARRCLLSAFNKRRFPYGRPVTLKLQYGPAAIAP